MKARIVIVFSLAVIVASCQGQDDMNRLTDKSFVRKQLDCILERRPCDKIGQNMKGMRVFRAGKILFKRKKKKKKRRKKTTNINQYRIVVNGIVIDLIPIIAYNNCQRCNPLLKQRYAKLRNFMLHHYPNEWNAIIQHYSKRLSIQG